MSRHDLAGQRRVVTLSSGRKRLFSQGLTSRSAWAARLVGRLDHGFRMSQVEDLDWVGATGSTHRSHACEFVEGIGIGVEATRARLTAFGRAFSRAGVPRFAVTRSGLSWGPRAVLGGWRRDGESVR